MSNFFFLLYRNYYFFDCMRTLNRKLFPALLVVLDDLGEQVSDLFQVDAAQRVVCSASLLVVRTPTAVSLYRLHHRGRAPTRQTAPQEQIKKQIIIPESNTFTMMNMWPLPHLDLRTPPDFTASSMRGLMIFSVVSTRTENVGSTIKSMNPLKEKQFYLFRNLCHSFKQLETH